MIEKYMENKFDDNMNININNYPEIKDKYETGYQETEGRSIEDMDDLIMILIDKTLKYYNKKFELNDLNRYLNQIFVKN